MTIGTICCETLESDINELIRDIPEIGYHEPMPWGSPIDMVPGPDERGLPAVASHIAADLGLSLENTNGSYGLLQDVIARTLSLKSNPGV